MVYGSQVYNEFEAFDCLERKYQILCQAYRKLRRNIALSEQEVDIDRIREALVSAGVLLIAKRASLDARMDEEFMELNSMRPAITRA
ncbi:MAG TPA: hypothetical protein VJG30_02370 [Candidatus Nanoarchaeia archaeon]|nr:hypothetical protein [Candidatus Nanoarchaeia archaeon]